MYNLCMLQLVDTQVEGSVQWVLLGISWKITKKTSCSMGYWDIPSLKLTARTSKMEILED